MARADSPSRDAHQFRLTLPFSPESAQIARREMDSWLSSLTAPTDVLDDCRLVVSELVGNSVRHAQPLADGTMEIGWSRFEDGLDIAVTDGGAVTLPRRVEAGLSDLAGRGLAIVEALATKWWIETSQSRTTVHALLDVS
jgi:anti-sigma regulatory factor (Ser/Thr protein kinase)